MKNTLLKSTIFLVFLTFFACKEEVIKLPPGSLKGKYTGKNVMVENPTNPNGIGFCVNEVIVNGKTTSDDITSESFEIDLKGLGIKQGEEVTIELKYSEGCTPKFLNPEVLE